MIDVIQFWNWGSQLKIWCHVSLALRRKPPKDALEPGLLQSLDFRGLDRRLLVDSRRLTKKEQFLDFLRVFVSLHDLALNFKILIECELFYFQPPSQFTRHLSQMSDKCKNCMFIISKTRWQSKALLGGRKGRQKGFTF